MNESNPLEKVQLSVKQKVARIIKILLVISIILFIVYQNIKITVIEKYTSINGDNSIAVCEIGSSIVNNPHNIAVFKDNKKLLSFTIYTDTLANFLPPIAEWDDNDELRLTCYGDSDQLTLHFKFSDNIVYVDWYNNKNPEEDKTKVLERYKIVISDSNAKAMD